MNTTLKIALPAFVAVLALAGVGAMPIPGAVDRPPLVAIAVVAIIGFAAARFGGFSLRGWLALVGGVLLGMAVSVVIGARLAEIYVFPDWFIARAGWVGALSFGLAELIAAAGIGYVTAGLTIARRRAHSPYRKRMTRVATIAAASIGSLLAAPALVLALSATVVGDDLLAPLNRDMADVSIRVDGSLSISPGVLHAGSNWYMLSNATDRNLALTMVPVDDDSDVERLLAGDHLGFAFLSFAEASPDQEPTLGRINLEPGRYAVYVDEGGTTEGQEQGPMPSIQPSSLVLIAIDE